MAATGVTRALNNAISNGIKSSGAVARTAKEGGTKMPGVFSKNGDHFVKPGFQKKPNAAGTGLEKGEGFMNKIKRNPGKTAAAGLGGSALAYYGYQSFAGGGSSGSPSAAGGSASTGTPQGGSYGTYNGYY